MAYGKIKKGFKKPTKKRVLKTKTKSYASKKRRKK
tara:strand:+ start:66 stop:170 length:105 start_codon:yes stop_codon:yes gene_type:complete